MMRESFADKIPLREWKLYIPIIFILVQIIRATTDTSAFAKRKFLLAYPLIIWLWLSIDDILFDSLDLMDCYKDDLDKILDLEKVGNNFIENYKNDDRAKSYGNGFTKDDLKARGKDLIRQFHTVKIQ